MTEFLHVGMVSGLLAGIGGLVAEVDPSGTAGASGFWIGITGIITALLAALGTIAQSFWADRQKERDFEILKLRVTLKADQNRRALVALYRWAADLPARVQGFPPIPSLPHGYEDASGENGDE